jgi:long-chain acyl-CoA synthetase
LIGVTTSAIHTALLPDQRAADRPADPCVRDERRVLDNAEFAAAVRGLAARFRGAGVRRGDVVAVKLPNCTELVCVLFAAWSVGAALTPVNPALTADEVRYQLSDSQAVLLVTDQSIDAVPPVVVLDARTIFGGGGAAPPVGLGGAASACEPDDTALIIYTSGTTGQPKGVVLDHANLLAMTSSIIEHFALTATDRSLLVLPLFHVNGLVVGILSVLRAGGDAVIAPRFHPLTFWDDVERHRPTFFSAVPTIYAMLESLDPQVAPDTSALRFVVCGAAPMSAELIRRFEARYGVPVIEGYGLSEGTVASVVNPLHGLRKPGTVGLPLPGQSVWVVDPHGKPLPPGQPGEVVITGPNLMRGYLGRPEETARTIRDGWLHTGDVGSFDEDGYLSIVGRIKEMIIRGGENIYPKEIENALYAHPAVLEAAVVGAPDAVFGEQPVAFVSTRPGYQITGDELIAHCRSKVAKFKVPRVVRIVAELPKNAVGKIAKIDLKKSLEEQNPR